MKSLVSVVVPVYNVSSYIGDCLESLYEQTYSNIEIILVNDASLDDSMVVAQPYINKLQSKYVVKVVNHEVNRGLSAARNTGVGASSGSWIYFLDSDDIITHDCIAQLVSPTYKFPDVDFVIGEIQVVGSEWSYPLKTLPYVYGNELILSSYIEGQWFVMAVNKLYRRGFLETNNISFKEGILHEDELYSFLIANYANSMMTVNLATYIYKVRSTGSIMSQRSYRSFQNWQMVLKEIFSIISQQYNIGNIRVPLSYCVNNTYLYVSMVLDSNILTFKEKSILIEEMKCNLRKMMKYRKPLTLKEKLRYYMLLLPNSVFSVVLHFRRSLIKE